MFCLKLTAQGHCPDNESSPPTILASRPANPHISSGNNDDESFDNGGYSEGSLVVVDSSVVVDVV